MWCCLSRFAGYEAGACEQAEQVVVTLKVLIGAVPTCMILTGLCILMVSPTPKVPRQNPSRQLSLQRWAPCARGCTRQASANIPWCEIGRSAGAPDACAQLSAPAPAHSSLSFSDAIFSWIFFSCFAHSFSVSLAVTCQRVVVRKASLLGPCALCSPRCQAPGPLA